MFGLDDLRHALEHVSGRPRVGIPGSSGDELADIIFAEFMKTAVEILDYLNAAARRPNASAATVKLAVVLASLWNQPPRTDSRAMSLYPWWMLAFLTNRTFIGPDVNEAISLRPYLRGTLDYLARVAAHAGSRGDEVERLAAEISRITQYAGEREASRAKNPWVALENIAYASETSVPTLDHVDAIEPQIGTALVQLSEFEHGRRDPFTDSRRGYEDYMPGSTSLPKMDRAHRDTQPLYVKPVEADPHIVPVWFGTNRKPVIEAMRPWFGSDSGDATELHLGRCEVTISDKHKFGSLDKQSWLSGIIVGKSGKPMHITRLHHYPEIEMFVDDLREELSKPMTKVSYCTFTVTIHRLRMQLSGPLSLGSISACLVPLPCLAGLLQAVSRATLLIRTAQMLANLRLNSFSSC